jgi:hypothetical protein
MVCFRYKIVNTQHEGDNMDGDDNDDYGGNSPVSLMSLRYKHSENGYFR